MKSGDQSIMDVNTLAKENDTTPLIVGVGGRAGSGKDPAAQVLAGFSKGPVQILRLATGLKLMLAGLYGIQPGSPAYHETFETGDGKLKRSPMPLIPGNTVRDDLIQLGDYTRAAYEDVWVADLLRRIPPDTHCVVIPDVRYPNELAICDRFVWVGPDTPGKHATESSLRSGDADWVFGLGDVPARLGALRAAAERIMS